MKVLVMVFGLLMVGQAFAQNPTPLNCTDTSGDDINRRIQNATKEQNETDMQACRAQAKTYFAQSQSLREEAKKLDGEAATLKSTGKLLESLQVSAEALKKGSDAMTLLISGGIAQNNAFIINLYIIGSTINSKVRP